jgi:hypothetical protein
MLAAVFLAVAALGACTQITVNGNNNTTTQTTTNMTSGNTLSLPSPGGLP